MDVFKFTLNEVLKSTFVGLCLNVRGFPFDCPAPVFIGRYFTFKQKAGSVYMGLYLWK